MNMVREPIGGREEGTNIGKMRTKTRQIKVKVNTTHLKAVDQIVFVGEFFGISNVVC
jgi:hypothetical protein